MPTISIPRLKLSLGQVAWAICDGRPPDPVTIDRLRYLRQLGVPFEREGEGSGNRRTYGFDQLIECALAMYAIRVRYKPSEVALVQVAERKALRRRARKIFSGLKEGELTAPWIKSRGAVREVLQDEQYIRLHARFSQTPGTFETVSWAELDASPRLQFSDLIERYPDGNTRPLVPLKRVMLPAVAWALEAPETRPGRK